MNAPAPAKARPTLMQRRRQGAIDDIVEAAIELFARDGFDATTVEAITDFAGCSRRTFYRYFESKEDVMFQDVPATFERLRDILDGHLVEGLGLWAAVSESMVDMIGRFGDDSRVQVRRMEMWQREPALNARYMQYIQTGERTVLECLCRHRGTRVGADDLAQTIAISAIGAYRATIVTHSLRAGNHKLTKHLRELLKILEEGLGDASRPR